MRKRFINHIDVMRQLIPIFDGYDQKERIQLMAQVNSFLSLPDEVRQKCEIVFGDRAIQREVLREGLRSLQKVNVGSLHDIDISKFKGFFLLLRRALIDFRPSEVIAILTKDFHWEAKDANKIGSIARDIEKGVNPRSYAPMTGWLQVLPKWLDKAISLDPTIRQY